MAHPERCECLHDLDRVRVLRERGARFQLDLGSLAGAYGRVPRRWARRLLDAGLYDVAGTDLHRPEQAAKVLDRWLAALAARADEAEVSRLTEVNPARVLDGEVLP
jgi:tyrosine-protein phosphatase YwqE